MEEIRKEALENEAAEPAVVEETAEKTAGSRLEKPKKKRKAVWITLGVIAAVLVGGCAAVIAVAATSDTIFNDTSVLGVELGGLTKEEAQGRWEARLRTVVDSTKIPLMMDGEELGQVSLRELGVSATAEDVAEAAYQAGRDENIFVNAWNWVNSWFTPTEVLPAWTVDEEAMRAKAEQLGVDLEFTVVDGAWRFDESKTDGFYVTKPADGKQVDPVKLLAGLKEMLDGEALAPVECEYLSVAAKPIDLAALHEELSGEMASAIYDKKNKKPTQSRVGVSFDLDKALAALDAAEPGTEFAVEGTVEFPKVTTEELEKVLFRDTLGSVTTYVSGTSNRISNVRLAAKSVNGTVVNPGESISYIDMIGPTTKARGYLPAPAYIGGKTVDSYGGGVCQVSSNLYYATLLSNLEIVKRYNHQYAPTYIKFGCDATVFAKPVDYVFRNDTDYPIKIVTSWSGYNLTVKIVGTKVDDTYVKVVSKTLATYPYKTIYKETDELAPGKTKVEQTPYTGYYVKTWRNVYAADGTLISSKLENTSEYDSRDQIILVGKKQETPAPDPTPTPDPEPTPDPTPTPDPEPTPDPTPTPDPEPTPDPTPTPDPEPAPGGEGA